MFYLERSKNSSKADKTQELRATIRASTQRKQTMKPLRSKPSSYTHVVTYKHLHPRLGEVKGSFRTTQDALKIHLKMMMQGLCYDIKVETITRKV